MKVDSVDLFYLRMPQVLDIGDGSQDSLLCRVSSNGFVGWGEAVCSPTIGIAAWITPKSHSGCHPVIDSILEMPILVWLLCKELGHLKLMARLLPNLLSMHL
jgi:hypothetical protein